MLRWPGPAHTQCPPSMPLSALPQRLPLAAHTRAAQCHPPCCARCPRAAPRSPSTCASAWWRTSSPTRPPAASASPRRSWTTTRGRSACSSASCTRCVGAGWDAAGPGRGRPHGVCGCKGAGGRALRRRLLSCYGDSFPALHPGANASLGCVCTDSLYFRPAAAEPQQAGGEEPPPDGAALRERGRQV